MEHLRRVIVPCTDNGYNFSFITSEIVSTYVVTITSVVKNSPADSAGLRIGDGIVSINGNLLRYLSQIEIQTLINNFRNSPLVLTVLQNFSKKYKSEENNEASLMSEVSSKTLPSKYSTNLYDTNSHKSAKPGQKYSKYSRNMSDVSDNSKFHGISSSQTHSRNSSPNKSKNLKTLSNNNSKNKLQLNRVGGLMRNSTFDSTTSNNIFMSKNDKPEAKRKCKLTYLTCSPTPYRSGRVMSNIETTDETVLRDQAPLNNFNNRFSEPIVKSSELFESNIEEEAVVDTEEDNTNIMNIDPVPVKIMWKYINDEEVHSPVLQPCSITVENGVFKVQEREEEEDGCGLFNSPLFCAEDGKPASIDSALKSKYIYNFSYYDSDQRKWEFLVEFADQNSSIKWMHFFDSPTPNEGRKYSRPSISEIIAPINYIQAEATPVYPVAKCEPSNKGMLHHALNRVRNFTQRRLTHADQSLDFKRQQEEWIQKTEPHFITLYENEDNKAIPVSICTDHVGCLNKVHIAHLTTLSLDKWQRSVTSPLIPLIVEICIKVIEKFGLNYTGIYRVSGNKLSLDALNLELRKPISDIDLSSDVWTDIIAISGVLKSFLRNLPDGVFPKEYYFDLISAWRMYEKDREKRLLSVQRLLNILESLPDHPEYRHNRETLRYLAAHLHLVASKNATNKMTVKNLAVVFAPTLLRPPIETNELLMSDYRFRIELVESIINHYEWMFSPGFESACNIPAEIEDNVNFVSGLQFGVITEEVVEEHKDEEIKGDARILIREIIDTVRQLSPSSPNNDNENLNQYTLIELNSNRDSSKQVESTNKVNLENQKTFSEEESQSGCELISNSNTKDKKSSKRSSLKVKDKRAVKSKNVKTSFPREQLLLTNKKLCALSIALISSNRHPLRTGVISNDDFSVKSPD